LAGSPAAIRMRAYDGGMIRRVAEHNQLNGVGFSTGEFAIVALAATGVSAAYGIQRHPLGALLIGGIALNSLVIVTAGVAAWTRGERGTPLKLVFSPKHREALTQAHPRLTADTLLVALAALAPFVLLLCVAIELARRQASRA